MNHLKHVLEAILAVGMAIGVATCTGGCSPKVASPEEITAAYAAELIACVQKSPTKEAADECRKQVNIKYGVCKQADWPRIAPGC